MHRRRRDENVSPVERIDECDPSSGRSVHHAQILGSITIERMVNGFATARVGKE